MQKTKNPSGWLKAIRTGFQKTAGELLEPDNALIKFFGMQNGGGAAITIEHRAAAALSSGLRQHRED